MKNNFDVYEYLEKLDETRFEFGLDRIKKVLEYLGNIQNNFKTIHVSGTNGKGTTSLFLHNILQYKNYKVGLYTSPHLQNIEERIVVSGQKISGDKFSEYIFKIKQITENLNIFLSYFEVLTVCAFLYFSDEKVDYAVIEVGLGGRLDATNVLDSPSAVILTNVSYDHTDYLGDTLEKILLEKIEIIKKGSKVVTGLLQNELINILDEKCKNASCELYRIKKDFDISFFDDHCIFKNKFGEIKFFSKDIPKPYLSNLSLSIEALEILGIKLDGSLITKILELPILPCRLETMQTELSCDVLLDAAHNMDSIHVFVEYIKKLSYNKKICVLAMLKDKDYIGMVRKIIPYFDYFYITEAKSSRTCNLKMFEQEFADMDNKKFILDYIEIIRDIKNNFGATDLVCFVGSFYMVGEIRRILVEGDYGK